MEGLEKEAGCFLESGVGEIENGSAGVSKVLWEHPVRVGDGSRGAFLLARSGCGGRARHLVEQGAFNFNLSLHFLHQSPHTYIHTYMYMDGFRVTCCGGGRKGGGANSMAIRLP